MSVGDSVCVCVCVCVCVEGSDQLLCLPVKDAGNIKSNITSEPKQ